MKRLFKTWVIGLEIIVIWINLVYCLVAFANESFLLAFLYLAVGVIVLILSLFGVLETLLNNFRQTNLIIVLLTKGVLVIIFLVQSLLQSRFDSVLVQEGGIEDISMFASVSTLCIATFFLFYELYLFSQKRS